MIECPKCGSLISSGPYGLYCSGQCGFNPMYAHIFEKAKSSYLLTKQEAYALLKGEEILLEGMQNRYGGVYDMYIKADGIKEYTYTKKDGTEATGYTYNIERRYPKKPHKGKVIAFPENKEASNELP